MLVPLKLPLGLYKQGTVYEAKDKWYDAQLVRFLEDTIRPIGGWTRLSESLQASLYAQDLFTADPGNISLDSKPLLTEDPSYNAMLGSAYLASLIEKFNGSYVLAIASYNAGPANVSRWLKQWGDPRSGDIDMVDWIELIPFSETRNYVQRVIENLQVYRERLAEEDGSVLKISYDINRGMATH